MLLLDLSKSIHPNMDCTQDDILTLELQWNGVLIDQLDEDLGEIEYKTARVILIDKRGSIWHHVITQFDSTYWRTSINWKELFSANRGQVFPLNENNPLLKETVMRLVLESNEMVSRTGNPGDFVGRSLLCIADLRPASSGWRRTNTFMVFYDITDDGTLLTHGPRIETFEVMVDITTPSRFRT